MCSCLWMVPRIQYCAESSTASVCWACDCLLFALLWEPCIQNEEIWAAIALGLRFTMKCKQDWLTRGMQVIVSAQGCRQSKAQCTELGCWGCPRDVKLGCLFQDWLPLAYCDAMCFRNPTSTTCSMAWFDVLRCCWCLCVLRDVWETDYILGE